MKIIIPAAGTGTRLRPHTYSQPKPLLHIAGKPMLGHVMDPVRDLHPHEYIFVIGYKGDHIRRYVATLDSVKARFVQQDNLLGLGYAVKLALDEIDGGPVVVLLSDTIVDCDLKAFTNAGENVIGVRAVDDPTRFGVAEIVDGNVVRLEEKPGEPRSNLAVIGLYYVQDCTALKKALNDLVASGKTTRGEIQLTDALAVMIENGIKFRPFEVSGWYDAGKKETMLQTNEILVRKMGPTQPREGSVLIDPVYVAPDATVTNCVLGPNVSVSSGTEIKNSIISNCIIGSNCRLDRVMLDDSLVGNSVTMVGRSRVVSAGDFSHWENT